jgi:hypothetical protein
MRWLVWILSVGVSLTAVSPVSAQSQDAEAPLVDVSRYLIQVEIEPDRSFLRGKAEVELLVLEETLSVPFDFSRNLSVVQVTDEQGTRFSLRGDDFSRDRIRIQSDQPLRAGVSKTFLFEFEGVLEREQYAFLDVPSTQKAVIDREGARLLSEGFWYPSHRLATNAASFRVEVRVPLGFSVVAPGTLVGIDTVGLSEIFTWESRAELTALPVLVARYYRQTFDEGPIPLTFYVTERFEGDLAKLAEIVEEMLGFFKGEYGDVGLEGLTLAQAGNVIVGSPGSRGLILLEDRILTATSPPLGELARRVALQWWGYSLRPRRAVDAWLADGFATFAALRFFQVKREDQFEVELAKQSVEALKYQDEAPISSGLNLEVGSARYDSIVAGKGAWVLYMLGQLMGPDLLHETLREFHGTHRDGDAAIADFARLVNLRTGEDYGWFFTQWVESVGIPEFRLDYTIFTIREGGYKIRGQVRQDLDLFRMPMDIRIETKGLPEEKHLMVNGRTTSFSFDTETLPLRMDIDPNGKILMDSDRMRVAVSVALGDEFREVGEFVSALQEYQRAIDLDPRSSLAHFRLGQTYFEQHSYSNAANSMRDSLNGDLKPEWVETWAHIYLGKVYDVLGQRQRARAEYQKAVNTQVDFEGAQAEARKYLDEPYSKPSTLIG